MSKQGYLYLITINAAKGEHKVNFQRTCIKGLAMQDEIMTQTSLLKFKIGRVHLPKTCKKTLLTQRLIPPLSSSLYDLLSHLNYSSYFYSQKRVEQ